MVSGKHRQSGHPVTAELPGAAQRVFDLLDPPLWLVTAAHGAHRGGLVATFATRASIVSAYPRMALGVAKQHHTWGLIQGGQRFVLHLLFPHQLDLVWRFGLQSGRETDKLAGIDCQLTPTGSPRLPQTLAWLDCSVEEQMDIGDRTIFLAAVESAGTNASAQPLTARRLFADAPEELRQRLDALYARDGRIDAEAIRRWRELKGSS